MMLPTDLTQPDLLTKHLYEASIVDYSKLAGQTFCPKCKQLVAVADLVDYCRFGNIKSHEVCGPCFKELTEVTPADLVFEGQRHDGGSR